MDNKKLKEIGTRIRESRKAKKLSQNELSEIVQVSPSYMSDIENGKVNISLEVFMRLTEALQVSADWLLRTDVPQVAHIQSGELSDILSDCSAQETQALIKMLRSMKATIRESKS